MGEVISLNEHVETSPILRKGDLVRLIDIGSYTRDLGFDDDDEDDEVGEIMAVEGHSGIVIRIEMVLPPSHNEAPGQATYVTIAVPQGDGWLEIESISTQCIRRIIGPEAHALRGY